MYTFRITTNGAMQRYKSGLYTSYKTLNDAMYKLQTGRNFNSYAEDPAAASRAFQLRRSMWRADDHLTNTQTLISRQEIAYTAIDQIVDGTVDSPGLDGIAATLSAASDTIGAARVSIGAQLKSTAESIVSVMNGAKYGEDFIFSGADGLTLPFKWEENSDGSKTLLYRGIDVNSSDHDDQAALEKMRQEATYVDIGLGFQEDADGKIIPSSAHNSSIQGIDVLGYGLDEDGDSRNVATLMMELGEIYSRCDPDSGSYASTQDESRAEVLSQKLFSAIGRTSQAHVQLSTDTAYLRQNEDQLEITQSTLNEQLVELEDADPAATIMDMAYAQYCYNAALRIGNNILSQSLLDYMQ